LPEIDGVRLHRNVERLAGMGDTERLELYLALLLGLIERLIRFTATGEGATPEERSLAKRLISPANLSVWAEAWEAISEARGEALALNLDRSLLVLDTWFRLQSVVREHPV
jgi:DNA polymerase III subunit delta'